MADTFTPNLNLIMPEVGADAGTWGTLLNGQCFARLDTYFPLMQGTTNKVLTITNDGSVASNRLNIIGAAGTNRYITFYSGVLGGVVSSRWTTGAAGNAEGSPGSNTGSDYGIFSVADDGTTSTLALKINRNNQIVEFSQIPLAAGSPVVTQATIPSAAGLSMVGEVRMWAGTGFADPPGGAAGTWMICNGRSLVRATYPTLFGVTGTAYGSSDGATFNIPDLRERVVVGQTNAAGRIPQYDGSILGNTFGEGVHVLIENEIPAHVHSLTDPGHNHTFPYAQANLGTAGSQTITQIGTGGQTATVSTHTTGITMGNTGGNAAHSNVQPTCVLNYIIRVQ